ncbi:MAG: hypothetical protein QXI33_03740 [Candidatus Pacearchaeota archaeon]
MENNVFYRRTIKVGNSSGVLLPKNLLGAEVKVIVLNPPINIRKDVFNLVCDIIDSVMGIYTVGIEKKKIRILVVSHSILKSFETNNYHIDVVPINILKKSIKDKPETKEKIKIAKPVLNKTLLLELKKFI